PQPPARGRAGAGREAGDGRGGGGRVTDLVPVIIGLGSNVDPERHLAAALARLARALEVTNVSSVYASDPVGAPGSARFLNAAVGAWTDLEPARLKAEVLRPIEAALGRHRTGDRNAPRTIDLDLLLYGEAVIEDRERGLRLPDPELLARAHVAVPAAEVWPEGVHPVTGETLGAIAARLATNSGLVRLSAIPGWAAGG
ncbi:MAG: 2-amino-4-hydroxy-6-hydroxymethyldihydropteridine diphosphokinase, partial [Thermoanaerobaculia bacterium]